MKKILAITAAAAATGYAGKPAPEAPKMPEAPVTPPAATKVAPVVTAVAALTLNLPTTRSGGQPSAYPFNSLEVGQFFGVKNKTKKDLSAAVTNANRKGKTEVTGDGGVKQTIVTRHFVAFDVTPELAAQIADTDLAGSTVLVQRDK